MDFMINHIGTDNLFFNGFNAVQFSILGMLIVFGGLTIITIYIILLPKLLVLPDKFRKRTTLRKGAAERAKTELLLAIAVALHLDQTKNGGKQRLTWPRHEEKESDWKTAGKIRGLAVRSHLPRRRPGR